MLTQEVLATPIARALCVLQSLGMNAADQTWATTVVTEVTDSCVRTICRSWGSHRALLRTMDLNDVAQASRVLVLTKVVKGFRIPEDAADSDSICRALHRYARRILNNHWIDTVRSIARDGTKRPISGSGGMEAVDRRINSTASSDGNELTVSGDSRWFSSENGEKAIEDTVVEGEMLGAMKGALTEENFNILYLRYQGLTTAEIGRIVGLTRKAVNERIRFRIKPVLAPRLRRHGFQVP